MTEKEEEEARRNITRWAKFYYAENEESVVPDVEIISIVYDEKEDYWEAELEVSTSADNPHVLFYVDPQRAYSVVVVSIEY